MDEKVIKLLQSSLLIGAGLLLIALLPLPIGFYTLLRIIVTLIAILFVIWLWQKEKIILTVLSSILVILFNPVFPIYLSRDVWTIIDFLTAVYFIISFFIIKTEK